MSLYARLRRHVPGRVLDWAFVIAQAVLIVLVVLYSDRPFATFPYLKL